MDDEIYQNMDELTGPDLSGKYFFSFIIKTTACKHAILIYLRL